MSEPGRWTPVKCGAIYCAPACGANCTWAKYQEAKRKAAALVKTLGKGWTPRVHENMGWSWGAISPCGRLKVYPLKASRGYHAFLGEPDFPGGQWTGSGTTPRLAANAAIASAKADLARIGAMVEGL